MPRNFLGVYSLPAGTTVSPQATIEASWANTLTADIRQALTESLDRGGRGGMTAQFRAINGSSSAPGISFNDHTGHGLYVIDGFTLGVTANGVTAFRVSSSGSASVGAAIQANTALWVAGNVGIPNSASIYGASAASDVFTSDTVSGLHNYGIQWRVFPGNAEPWCTLSGFRGIRLYSNGLERMRIDGSGDVGIGAPPQFSSGGGLGVYSPGDARITLRNATTGAGATAGGGLAYIGVDMTVLNRESGAVIFSTVNTERVRVKPGGSLRLVPLASDPAGTEHGDIWALSSGVFRRNRNGIIETW